MALAISKVYLAPMEGVTDPPMRKVLTRHGAYDACTSEFIRVTDEPIPNKTLIRYVPELKQGAVTDSGCPCRVQLLGDVPESLAITAKRAVALGANAIDLNFGCPSRFVHHGGSMLLKEPELLNRIVSTVREALDPAIHLSIKFRTGFASSDELPTIIKAMAVDGVNELIIHARTRKDLYRAEAINHAAVGGIISLTNGIPVVANGDIVDMKSSKDCAALTNTDRQMIGRAALGIVNIAQVLKSHAEPCTISALLNVVWEFALEMVSLGYADKSVMDRMKQFLGYARKFRPGLNSFFRVFARCQSVYEAQHLLVSYIEHPDQFEIVPEMQPGA